MSIDAFETRGYTIVPDFFRDGELDELDADLEALGKLVVGPDFSVTRMESYALSEEKQSMLYDRLTYLPALSRLSGSGRVMQLCRELGMRLPSLMGCCNMRLDRPHDGKHLFDWHQDTLYLLGSQNAITLWLPLQKVDLHHGTIQVVAGSHQRGIYPFQKISDKPIAPDIPMLQRDLRLDYEVTEAFDTIEAKRGDAVVFKQMLLHRSTANHSSQIRWTAQLRIMDLGDEHARRQGFPTGDRTNIYYVDYPGYHPNKNRIPA